MKKIYAALAETMEDCRKVINWQKKKQVADLKIIALSLEALAFLEKHSYRDYASAWEFLPMDEILDQSLKASQLAAEQWSEEALRYELEVNGFYHDFVSLRVAEKMAGEFKKNNWIYLIPDSVLIWQSKYLPGTIKQASQNIIFKEISAEVFKKAGIKIKYTYPKIKNQLRKLQMFLALPKNIINRWYYDVLYILQGQLKKYKTIDQILSGCPDNINVLISGWGSNISRVLSLEELKKQISQKNKINCLNLIWRPDKIPNFDQKKMSGPNFYNEIIQEEIRAGVAYGPKISMFPLSFYLKYLKFLLRDVLMIKIKKIFRFEIQGQELKEILKYPAVKIDTALTVFFADRAIYLGAGILSPLFKKLKPKIFIGSDSGASDCRAEILLAQKNKVMALSTPHSYPAYSVPTYNYLADKILTHGLGSKDLLLKSGIKAEKIKIIGNSHSRTRILEQHQKTQIVIATRSRHGLWSNYSAKQNIYHQELINLLNGLSAEDKYETVIKTHPNGDLYNYYDLIAEKYDPKKVKHIPKGWKLEKFSSYCDLLICLGEATSFYISAPLLKIPVIFINSPMTKVLKKLNYDLQDIGAVAKNSLEALEIIRKILQDLGEKEKMLERQEKFVARYTRENPELNLANQLAEIIGPLKHEQQK